MITATIGRGRIWIGDAFHHKDKIKNIPGASWGRAERRWHIPATPHAAGALRNVGNVCGGIDAAPEVRELFRMFDASTAAQAFKTCPIDEVPIVTMKTKPWDHQRRGIAFGLANVACLLYWGMGCGKTAATLGIINGANAQRTLVLCPKAVIDVWPLELKKHSVRKLDCLTLTKGTTKKKAASLGAFMQSRIKGDGRIVVVNYESAWRDDLAKALLGIEWDCVVLDEIHRIKSPSGKASKFCAKLRAKTKRVIGLSGTVLPHGPMDAFAIFKSLDPGIFGTVFTNFRSRYGVMGGFNGRQVVRYQNIDDLGERMDLITFHASRDLLDLPPETDVDRYVQLDAKEAKLYADLETELCAEVEAGEVTAQNALVKLLKLQQATGGFAVTDDGTTVEVGKSRRKALADILEDVHPSDPVVVFCKFHADLESVHAVAADLKRGSLELSGRRNELEYWQNGDEAGDAPPILAVQIQAGGIGVSLVRSSIAIFYSIGFSLGDFDQAKARVHRPGQENHVTNVHMIAQGTVDETIRRALAKKENVIGLVLEHLKGKV
jgi:SNF2 family DNA or RNA helicase